MQAYGGTVCDDELAAILDPAICRKLQCLMPLGPFPSMHCKKLQCIMPLGHLLSMKAYGGTVSDDELAAIIIPASCQMLQRLMPLGPLLSMES